MLSVLFWNLNGKRRESLVANLVRLHHVDVLILAECQKPTGVLRELNGIPGGRKFHWHRTSQDCRLKVFSRFSQTELFEVESTRRFAVHALATNQSQELLIASAHTYSGKEVSELDQEEELRALAKRVAEIEDIRQHTRTLLIGDLNATPHDRRVFAAGGLHAVQSRLEAAKGQRRVQWVSYRFFYNPMWRFDARQPPDPPGTYYRRKAEHATRFWYLFDQVLLRPALLSYFADTDVSILTSDGTTTFQKADGTPDKKVASDHFPILIHLS